MKLIFFLIIILIKVLLSKRTKLIGKYVLYPKQKEMLEFDGVNEKIGIDWNRSASVVQLTVENWLNDAQHDYNKTIKEKIINVLKIIEKNID